MKTIKVVYISAIISAALILSYIESAIPFNFGIVGAKLGLANVAVITALYLCGTKAAICVSAVRIALSALLFGNLVSLLYSAAGGLLSLCCMIFLKKTNKFGIIGVSVAGGVMHNAGQLGIALLALETPYLAYHIPALTIAGVVAGIAVGAAAGVLVKRLPSISKEKPSDVVKPIDSKK